MSALLSSIGDVFSAVIGWAGAVGTTVTGNNLLLLCCVGIPLCGVGVGMFTRLIRARA